jgi:hypothetical protein
MTFPRNCFRSAWSWLAGTSTDYSELQALFRSSRELEEREALLREKLIIAENWKRVVLDALIVNWAYKVEHEDDPRLAVRDLIHQEVLLALDPSISDEAQALVDRGVAQATGQGELG